MDELDNIKIVFIDIDGTLVNDEKEVSLATSSAIQKIVNKGIYVVITSGRDLVHTIDKSKNANCSPIVISCGGGIIYNYEKNDIIFADLFDFAKVKLVWDYCLDNEVGLILKSNTTVYYNKYSLVTSGLEYKLISDISEITDTTISHFLIMSDCYDKINNVYKYVSSLGMFVTSLSSSYLDNTVSDYYSIDVNDSNVSKGTAVNYLLNYLNLKKEESMSFGDYINDLDMFSSCGVNIAMGNSCSEIKEKADFITKSNNEDGVAWFLNKYLWLWR